MTFEIKINELTNRVQDALREHNKSIETQIQPITAEKRIDIAKDDYGGWSISNKMNDKSIQVTCRNIQDGASMMQNAIGNLVMIINLLNKITKFIFYNTKSVDCKGWHPAALEQHCDPVEQLDGQGPFDKVWGAKVMYRAGSDYGIVIGAVSPQSILCKRAQSGLLSGFRTVACRGS